MNVVAHCLAQLGTSLVVGSEYLGGLVLYKAFKRTYQTQNHEMCRKAVVITGCDSGLGFSFALHSYKIGLTVFATVLDMDSLGAKKLRSLVSNSQRMHVLPLNLTSTQSVFELTSQVRKMLVDYNLQFHCLVNNAGVMVMGNFGWLTDDLIEHQITVNLRGPINVTKHLLPTMKIHKTRLINIVSHCALASLPNLSVYGATKAGVMAWSDSLRIELKPFDIHVIKFIPGSFVTQSQILVNQPAHFEWMRASMPNEVQQENDFYFERFVKYISGIPTMTSAGPINDNSLNAKFVDALLNPKPSDLYIHAPFRYTIYHFWFNWTPTWLRDTLVNKFVAFPPYKL